MDITPEQALVVAQIALKFRALSIKATPTTINPGPVVTTYYYRLSDETPIAKILKAEEDIALSVSSAGGVIISRHGGAIAIAIPNKEKTLVSYDNCMDSLMRDSVKALPIMLGVDPTGQPQAFDLADAPHVLIAGSTGAGKSVFLASIISCLATKRSKNEMKLMLFDTKKLDLPLFEQLPHVVEMAEELDQVHSILDRLHLIVRQRTEKMRGLARNIKEYNSLGFAKQLPYYVIIIDELADILLQDRSRAKGQRGYEKAETKLQQLLQISRAAGVHFIIATQRPSVEIITGDIKANLPTRIALRLPTSADSRTIISTGGAEKLLGKGDMLIESPLFDEVSRFHGPYVGMSDIARVLVECDQIREMYKMLQGGV